MGELFAARVAFGLFETVKPSVRPPDERLRQKEVCALAKHVSDVDRLTGVVFE